MSVFGQVIPFRPRRESNPAQAKRVHRSLSAALAEAGLAEPPPLADLTVEPEAGVLADNLFPADEPAPADESPLGADRAEPVHEAIAYAGPPSFAPAPPAYVPPPPAAEAPIPQTVRPAPAAVPAEPPLPRVIALATRRPPDVASYPWVKAARKRRLRTTLSDTASWVVTLVIMAGMIGVAAAFLSGPHSNPEPVAQR
jgi:hypothetical protein